MNAIRSPCLKAGHFAILGQEVARFADRADDIGTMVPSWSFCTACTPW